MAAHQACARAAGSVAGVHPGFLAAFAAGRRLSSTQLASSDARAVLAIAPSPAEGLQLSQAKVETALRRSGRSTRSATQSTSSLRL
jgi:hypothetical protein